MHRGWISRVGAAVAVATFAIALAIWPVTAAAYAWEAYLVEGTCAAPVSLLGRIGDAGFGVPVGVPAGETSTPVASPAAVGAPSALPVLTGTFAVPVALDALLATPHAVAVEGVDLESGARTAVACGDIGGVPTAGELLFGLRAKSTDTAGVGWLRSSPDGTTLLTLFITQGSVGVAESQTPVPPTSTAAAGVPTEVTVASYDIYFEPKEVTIPADTDVVIRLPTTGPRCTTSRSPSATTPTWRTLASTST